MSLGHQRQLYYRYKIPRSNEKMYYKIYVYSVRQRMKEDEST